MTVVTGRIGVSVTLASCAVVLVACSAKTAVTAPQTSSLPRPTTTASQRAAPSPTGTAATLTVAPGTMRLTDLKAGLRGSQLGVEVVRHAAGRVNIVTTGGASCTPTPASAVRSSAESVTIVVRAVRSNACQADIQVLDTTASFDGLDESQPLHVTVVIPSSDVATWTLPPV
jgi:hypothetical protein